MMGPDDVLRRNCPFYGHHMYLSGMAGAAKPFLLLNTWGNQCGLIQDRQAPCRMEMAGEDPEWHKCILVQDIRMEPNT